MDAYRAIIDDLRNNGDIPEALANELTEPSWSEIQIAIQRVLAPVANSYSDLIAEEIRVLRDGITNGIPPITERTTSRIIFEMNPNDLQRCRGRTREIQIAPVRRLSTVTVQVGYRREVDTNVPGQVVDTAFPRDLDRWYPGIEFLGEGLFITLGDQDGWQNSIQGDAAYHWQTAFDSAAGYPAYVFRDQQSAVRTELHPGFVWWHTLSHLLIRSLAIEAGYASAAIRERVYVELSERGPRGGLLIYATQPGSEGTMGGLIALAPSFSQIMNSAFETMETCSGDPLCEETGFESGHYNGAACYGCLLLSETSCEHRNMWLDRVVLRDNPP